MDSGGRRSFLKTAGLIATNTIIAAVENAPQLDAYTASDEDRGLANEQSNAPAIFYSPHQDDEAIAMAGGICQHKAAGRTVYLVLLSDGSPSTRMQNILLGRVVCPLHGYRHSEFSNWTIDQIIWARKMEMICSARQLGVDKLFIIDHGQGLDDNEDYASKVNQVKTTVRTFDARYPGADHKLISGQFEQSSGYAHPTHAACWEAAVQLSSAGEMASSQFRFHRVYEYYKEEASRTSNYYQLALTNEWQAAKQSALDEYKTWDPPRGRVAFGHHSVSALIDAAYGDAREYIDRLP